MGRSDRRRRTARAASAFLAAVTVVLTVAGCGGGDDTGGPGAAGDATPAAGAAPGATASAPAPLDVLVTNDDGVAAAGIDAVVRGLRDLPGVTVTVVAPAANQSGTGGKTTVPTPAHHDAATAGGTPATAVDGFPADAVTVALDVLRLTPDLVVSGVNQGQNLGPVVDLSGTVGAARAAAARGIPAIASSMGTGDAFDFAPAAKLVTDWVTAHRAELPTGTPASGPRATIANLNIPNCAAGGRIRGQRELPTQPTLPDLAAALAPQDCTSSAEPDEEVAAFTAGFATLTEIPARPATPAAVVTAAPAAPTVSAAPAGK
ncbi:5'/3'-nucleotidase SurE [Parafrankia discariae]|uniref:5'/3'-nucleotidase SurE n=1 Tax=Parafrankia discariae TaxID=365528 RepID=UPI001E47254B|nr:5'/3'-nucleotidase SurE [Parafrankia discariae]